MFSSQPPGSMTNKEMNGPTWVEWDEGRGAVRRELQDAQPLGAGASLPCASLDLCAIPAMTAISGYFFI